MVEGMFPRGEDPRVRPPGQGGELATLTGFLRLQRHTFELKCADLTPEQLAERAVPPSTMSLLGMIRHLADVERGWFRRRMARQDEPWLFRRDDREDWDWEGAVAERSRVDEAWAAWRTETAFADRFIAEAPNLDITCDHRDGDRLSLRWLLSHMIEEYARHNGHADLLRERIDGAVGE